MVMPHEDLDAPRELSDPGELGDPGELDALMAALEADTTLVAETARSIRATLPGYEGVPETSLEASIRRNLALSMHTILDGRAPDPAQIDEAETLALERMDQGVSIGSVLAGFRICMTVILRRLHDLAPDLGLPAEQVLSCSTLLWSLGDAFSTRAVVAHQERSITQAVADSARRARWIVDAVVTGLPRTDLLSGAAAHGVPADAPVRALHVASADRATDPAPAVHEWARRVGASVLLTPHGETDAGVLVGELPAAPSEVSTMLTTLTAPGVIAAVGPLVTLEDLPESFAAATRVLAAARQIGHHGIADLELMSWRMGITASPETTQLLHRRHLDPVREEGQFSEFLLEAVRAYLRHGLSIPRAAESIPVHVNTLRYRLKRFRELTGTDLHDPDDLIEVSWALAAEQGSRLERS